MCNIHTQQDQETVAAGARDSSSSSKGRQKREDGQILNKSVVFALITMPVVLQRAYTLVSFVKLVSTATCNTHHAAGLRSAAFDGAKLQGSKLQGSKLQGSNHFC